MPNQIKLATRVVADTIPLEKVSFCLGVLVQHFNFINFKNILRNVITKNVKDYCFCIC